MTLEIKKLDRQELLQFNLFLLEKEKLTRGKIITPIFRGDKLENLFIRLGIDYSETQNDYKELLYRLFMIGEKAKHFYSTEFYKPNYTTAITIDDCNEKVFEYIFDNISITSKSNNSHTRKFFNRNIAFKDFFQNKRDNKKQFVSNALSANVNEQKDFRNYYLTLLHQLGSIKYKNKTHLVSASTDKFIAESFAINKLTIKGIILHAWKPSYKSLLQLKKFGLPKYTNSPYPHQKEISILAGILPHYIIGLEIIEDKEFYINPSIFSNTINCNLFTNGLEINQDNFDEVLKQTKYEKPFVMSGNQIQER